MVRVPGQPQRILFAVKLPVAVIGVVGVVQLVEGELDVFVNIAQHKVQVVVAPQKTLVEIRDFHPVFGGVARAVQVGVQQVGGGTCEMIFPFVGSLVIVEKGLQIVLLAVVMVAPCNAGVGQQIFPTYYLIDIHRRA